MIAALTLLLAAPLFAEAPAWTKAESSLKGGKLLAVGIAPSIHGAVAGALCRAAKLHAGEAKTPAAKRTSVAVKDFAKHAFGPVVVTVMVTDAATAKTQSVEETCQVSLEKGSGKYRIRANTRSETSGDLKNSGEEATIQLNSSGLDLQDLIRELAAQGFAFKEWRDPADYTQFAVLERGKCRGGVEARP